MKHEIAFVDKNHQHEIEQLRRQEYAQASGYSLDLNSLRWQTSDDESFVMVAKDNGTIVATMRGEVILDPSVLEKKLECPWDFETPRQLPVLLLSRAATLKSYQAQGLNLVMRYWFLKLAEHYRIPMVVGTFVTGSPRQNTLLSMGYQFHENKQGWQQSTYRSHRDVIVAVLDMENKPQAFTYCENKFVTNKNPYALSTDFPEIKYVRSL
ncbi:MAG: hypothetical protein JNL11_17795 [Bdellovibrionaceae bacterium]|nr:hypothetical protein [Pseudobdellovibrionaceae bacterium]